MLSQGVNKTILVSNGPTGGMRGPGQTLGNRFGGQPPHYGPGLMSIAQQTPMQAQQQQQRPIMVQQQPAR